MGFLTEICIYKESTNLSVISYDGGANNNKMHATYTAHYFNVSKCRVKLSISLVSSILFIYFFMVKSYKFNYSVAKIYVW
jgi:hypothetical protein